MPGGEFVTCPKCQGWDASETGAYCDLCDNTGQIWVEYPELDDSYVPEAPEED